MSKSYYEKELEDQPIYVGGKAYRFHLLETEDEQLIQHLDSAAAKHIGGIIKLTEEEHNKKKAAPSPASSQRPHKREEIRQKVITSQPNRSRKRSASVAVDEGAATPQEAAQSQDMSAFIPKPARGVLQ